MSTTLHVEVRGRGPDVVLLHGWALGQHTYRDVVERIASDGVRVIAPSLPMSASALTASCAFWNLARSFLAAAICASKSASLNSGRVLMNASSVAISEPSR